MFPIKAFRFSNYMLQHIYIQLWDIKQLEKLRSYGKIASDRL